MERLCNMHEFHLKFNSACDSCTLYAFMPSYDLYDLYALPHATSLSTAFVSVHVHVYIFGLSFHTGGWLLSLHPRLRVDRLSFSAFYTCLITFLTAASPKTLAA